jgi:hypothetical protein
VTRARFLLSVLIVVAISFPGAALAVTAGSGVTFKVVLRGTNVVPSGNPKGAGYVVIKVHPAKSRICWKFSSFTRMGKPIGATINEAPIGSRGPVVATLGKPYNPSGCAKASKNVMASIIKRPALYYLTVDTAAHPAGAIRGQLGA